MYGGDLDAAFRLLDAPRIKRALREAASSPLVFVVSDEIFTAIVRHGYVDASRYGPAVRVLVGERRRRGWVHIPVPEGADRPAASRLAKGLLPLSTPLSIAQVNGHGLDRPQTAAAMNGQGPGQPRNRQPVLNGRGGPRQAPG